MHHPLDALYDSVVDEPQPELISGFSLVTHTVGSTHRVIDMEIGDY